MNKVTFVIGVDPPNVLTRITGTWQRWVQQRAEELVKRLTDLGVQVASVEFANAIYDGTNDVSVSFDDRGPLMRAVVATGGTTLFI